MILQRCFLSSITAHPGQHYTEKYQLSGLVNRVLLQSFSSTMIICLECLHSAGLHPKLMTCASFVKATDWRRASVTHAETNFKTNCRNYNYGQIINKFSVTEDWAHPWAWALRSQGGSGGAGWRARSLGEGGGSLSGTGSPHWWGTSRSDARQIAPWHTHRTSRTGRQAHKRCCYHTYLSLD